MPPGIKDFASDQLAKKLADVYERFSGQAAMRRVLVDERKTSESHVEYGPFKEFIDEVLSIIPRKLRQTETGAIPSSDSFVRKAVKSRKS